MKNLTTKLRKGAAEKLAGLRKFYLLLLALPFVASSCYIEYEEPYGYDGRAGDAYLAIDWDYEMPTYLDVGNNDIPHHFDWGRYYIAYPGLYELYYEGEYWDGYAMAWYAYEVKYEIWRNYGSSGGPGYDGNDGADSRFTLVLSPYGCFKNRWNKSQGETNYEVLSESEDEIVVEQTEEEYSMKITYKKVPRRES